MLERASSSAECTAHLLLRRLELPTRSRRVLGPAFWRNAGDQLDVPAWWPIYLTNIRRGNRGGSVLPEVPLPTTLQSRNSRPDVRRHLRRTLPKDNYEKPRSFTRSVEKTQESAPILSYDEDVVLEASSRDDDEGIDIIKESSKDTNSENAQSIHKPFNTIDTPQQEEKPDFSKAWQLFIRSGQKGATASRIMHLLAQSEDRPDLRRALTAYNYIDRGQCSRKDFDTAVRLAIQLHSYKAAVSIVQDATSRGIGEDVYFMFMAHCVKNTLWNTLATLWDSVGDAKGPKFRVSKSPGIKNESPNLSGKYSFHFDDIADFPTKIVSLAERLHRHDAVLAFHREALVELCRRLVYIAVESEKVMGSITGKGILSLFHVQQQFGFDSKLHLVALATLASMPDNGAKSQLAIMIYRNYRFVNFDAVIPRWVYGSLISICAASRQPPETYHFLLDEFRRFHDRPDEAAYRSTIQALAAQGEADAVLNLFNKFQNDYGPRTTHDLNSLIHVYAVVGDRSGAQKQFDRLTNEFNCLPDVVSWTSLVLAHARSADGAEAYRVFQDMAQHGVKPNAYTWSIVMSVAAKRGDVGTARSLYQQALKEKVSGDLYMVGALVEAFVMNGQLSHAEAIVIRSSKVQSSESPIRLWNTLFRHYAFKGTSKDILRLQDLMKEYNVQADGMTYAALMTALVVQKRTEDAAKILRTLHFSQSLSPTEFHYSILIHGFVLEKKRDMAIVIYHEMLERFPKVTPSARLAMLHLQMARDASSVEKARIDVKQPFGANPKGPIQTIPWTGLDYLADTLIQRSPSDLASKQPNPGFSRQSPRDGLDSIYFNSLVGFLQSSAAFSESQRLMEVSRTLYPNENSPTVAIRGLTLEMNVAISQGKWQTTKNLWDRIVNLAQRAGSSLDNMSSSNSMASYSLPVAEPHHAIGLNGEPSTFKPMIPSASAGEAIKPYNMNKVIPAQRFAISEPLSKYLQALDYQRQHADVLIVVQELLQQGFELSSKNWNRYVQVLSKSPVFDHRVLACEAFEKHLLPNMPIWRLLYRGKWLDKKASRAQIDEQGLRPNNRDNLEKVEPDVPRPTYFTMIHLALVLLKANRSAADGNSQQLNTLRRRAPGTFDRAQKTPYFGDRIQGLLLRGRKLIGDPVPRPRAARQVLDVSGVKGSKSPLDNIPPEILERLEDVIVPRDDIRTLVKGFTPSTDDNAEQSAMSREVRLNMYQKVAEKIFGKINRDAAYLTALDRFENETELKDRVERESGDKLDAMLKLGEQLSGEIDRKHIYLVAQDRKENTQEREDRIEAQQLQKLELIAQMQKDAYKTSLVGNSYTGEPAVDLPSTQIGTTVVPRTVYVKEIADSLMPQKGSNISELAAGIHDRIKSSKIPATETEATSMPTLSIRPKSTGRLARRVWAPDAEDVGIDTRVLARRIDVNEKQVKAAQKAFTKNKAKRRERIEQRQDFARWEKANRVHQYSEPVTGRTEQDAPEASVDNPEEDGGRVHRLSLSRGARRFG